MAAPARAFLNRALDRSQAELNAARLVGVDAVAHHEAIIIDVDHRPAKRAAIDHASAKGHVQLAGDLIHADAQTIAVAAKIAAIRLMVAAVAIIATMVTAIAICKRRRRACKERRAREQGKNDTPGAAFAPWTNKIRCPACSAAVSASPPGTDLGAGVGMVGLTRGLQ